LTLPASCNRLIKTKLNPKLNRFRENQLIYLYNNSPQLDDDTLKMLYEQHIKVNYEKKEATLIDKTNFLIFSCNHLAEKQYDFDYNSKTLSTALKDYKTLQKDSLFFNQLDQNLDIKLIYYYYHHIDKAAAQFEKGIDEMFEKYKEDEENQLPLARTLAYYNKVEKVNELVAPHLGTNSKNYRMIILNNKINQEYIDLFGNVPQTYMDQLIKSFDNLGKEQWCSQFVGKGNISFQIFDYLTLYHKYCDECAPYDNAGTQLGY
jgi:hypothetical protein